MNTISLNLEDPIRDAISRIRFGPHSNNLLISSWDSSLRLYDVDSSKLRMEAPGKASLLDCCFENERVCLTAESDGSIYRYDLDSGVKISVGINDDVATCVEYSPTTCQIISAGWDRKINFWDARSTQSHGCLNSLASEVGSMSLSEFSLIVAAGSSVDIYDLRSFKKSVHTKGVKVNVYGQFLTLKDLIVACLSRETGCKVGCALCPVKAALQCRFIVGSVDERVLLEYICRSSSDEGYAFRCHPKSKDGRRHLVTVNDIAFNPSIIGSFVTGDNDGYVTLWDARGRKRMFEMPRYPKSVVSLSYSHDGMLLAVASSYAYQEANEIEEPPQIFMHHEMGNCYLTSPSSGASKYK